MPPVDLPLPPAASTPSIPALSPALSIVAASVSTLPSPLLTSALSTADGTQIGSFLHSAPSCGFPFHSAEKIKVCAVIYNGHVVCLPLYFPNLAFYPLVIPHPTWLHRADLLAVAQLSLRTSASGSLCQQFSLPRMFCNPMVFTCIFIQMSLCQWDFLAPLPRLKLQPPLSLPLILPPCLIFHLTFITAFILYIYIVYCLCN